MSAEKSTPSSPAPDRTPDAVPASTKPGRWRRRLRRLAVVLVVVLLVGRIALEFLLPVAVSRAARQFGFDAEYRRLTLSITGTQANIWDLVLRPREGGQTLLKVEYANADLSTWQLFRLALVAYRIEADGVELTVHRKPDGLIPLLEHLQVGMARQSPPPAESAPSKPIDFTAPLQVEAIRLHNVNLRLLDEAVSPVFDDTITVAVRISDIGHASRPATLGVDVLSRGLLQAVRLDGELDARGPSLVGDLRFSALGLQLQTLEAYLNPLGIAVQGWPMDLTGRVRLQLDAMPDRPGSLTGQAHVSDISMLTAGRPTMNLASGRIEIAELSPSLVHLGRIEVEQGRLTVRRSSEGHIELASLTTGATPTTRPAPIRRAVALPPQPSTATPVVIRIDELRAADLSAVFEDRVPPDPVELEAKVMEFTVKGIRSDRVDQPVSIAADLALPGLMEQVRLDGSVTPAEAGPSASIELKATGIKPDRVKPYLQALSLEHSLQSGEFRARLVASARGMETGKPELSLEIEDVALADAGQTLLAMPSLAVRGFSIDPETGLIELAEVVGTGPYLTLRRVDEHTLQLPGLLYRPDTAKPFAGGRPVGPAAVASSNAPMLWLPPIHLRKLRWEDVGIRLEDLATADASRIALDDTKLAIDDLRIDLRPDAPAATPGRITAHLRSPGLIESLDVTGIVTPGPGSIGAALSVRGEGIDLRPLTPYLAPLGIEPQLAQAQTALSLEARLATTDQRTGVSLKLADAELTDGQTRWLGLAGLSVDEVAFSAQGMSASAIRIQAPAARLEVDEKGRPIVAGLLIKGTDATKNDQPISPEAIAQAIASLGPIKLEGIELEEARIELVDASLHKPVDATLNVSATFDRFQLNTDSPQPTRFVARLGGEGLADELSVDGTLVLLSPRALSLEANIRGRGISGARAAGYLPPGMEPSMTDGTLMLRAALQARVLPDDQGIAASCTLSELALKSAGQDSPSAAVESVLIDLARFDPSTGDTLLRHVGVKGVELDAVRRPDGAIEVPGVRIMAAPPAADTPVAPPDAGQAPAELEVLLAAAQQTPPLLALDELDIELRRITFQDQLRRAEPISLADLRVTNPAPIRLLGEKPAEHEPVQLRLTGRIDPLVDQFEVATTAALFIERPTLHVSVQATGIRGEPLARIVPEVAGLLDGGGLDGAVFATTFDAEANVRRRGPAMIDLSRGLDVSFNLQETALKTAPDGAVLAGVKSVRGEGIRIDTVGGNVTARSLEISDLTGSAWRDADGLHVLGLRIALLDKGKPAPVAEEASPVASADAAPELSKDTAEASSPMSPEYRINRLLITGLDFTFEDRVLDPPLLVPVTALDADIRGLSSHALTQDRPIRFNLSVVSGQVPLPKRVQGGVLTGALSDLGGILGGRQIETSRQTEMRDFFSQIIASGDMRLHPKPQGRIMAAVSGLELAAIRGVAQTVGIGLSSGVFDGRVELQSRDDGQLAARTRLVLTELRMSDSPDGAIVRYLNLPAPLDAVIAAVEAPDKSITLPINFTVVDGSPRGIAPAAVGALSQVLIAAVASAPVKMVTGVAGLFGSISPNLVVIEDPPRFAEYQTGVVLLDRAQGLTELFEEARRDPNLRMVIVHELGAADLALAELRANPSPEQARRLVDQLQRQRQALLARRAQALQAARASAMGVSSGDSQDPWQAYRDLLAELALVEESLDTLYELQRPGAERQAPRRTRAAAIEIARARLDAVRNQLIEQAGERTAERVQIRAPEVNTVIEGPSRLVISVARAVPRNRAPAPTPSPQPQPQPSMQAGLP